MEGRRGNLGTCPPVIVPRSLSVSHYPSVIIRQSLSVRPAPAPHNRDGPVAGAKVRWANASSLSTQHVKRPSTRVAVSRDGSICGLSSRLILQLPLPRRQWLCQPSPPAMSTCPLMPGAKSQKRPGSRRATNGTSSSGACTCPRSSVCDPVSGMSIIPSISAHPVRIGHPPSGLCGAPACPR